MNTEREINRDEIVKMKIMSVLDRGYEKMYSDLDRLHREDINDDDVIRVLQEKGEMEVLTGYTEWADIDLPDGLDPEETSDDVVPDPHDAPSYDAYPAPKRRVETFTAGVLLDKVLRELPMSSVAQTGGNTATLIFRKEPGDTPILGGPGIYHWALPTNSEFHTADFHFGPDTIGIDGQEPRHDTPGETVDPHWTLDQMAERIMAAYTKYNDQESVEATRP